MWRALALLLISFPAWADLEPGTWEITSRTEVEGVPEPKAITHMHCLKAEDTKDPSRIFGTSDAGCEFTEKNDTGSVMTFKVVCRMEPPVRGAGSVRYGPHSLNGDLEIRLENFVTRSQITGRRIGGC